MNLGVGWDDVGKEAKEGRTGPRLPEYHTCDPGPEAQTATTTTTSATTTTTPQFDVSDLIAAMRKMERDCGDSRIEVLS